MAPLTVVPSTLDEEHFRMRGAKGPVRPFVVANEGNVSALRVVVLEENRAASRWARLVVIKDSLVRV